ncbi:hypothetical protein QOT17_007899 [Balamuthia mandrillaris]
METEKSKNEKVPLLGISDLNPLILVEGDQDLLAVCKFAELCNLQVSQAQLLVGATFLKSDHFAPLVKSINKLRPGVATHVHVLRDPDFYMFDIEQKAKEESKANVKVFYWNLPSIESFYFVYWCYLNRDKDPFVILRDPSVLQKLMAKYMTSVRQQNPKQQEEAVELACERWIQATKLLDNQNPTLEDIQAVARIVHGHTWLNKFSQGERDGRYHGIPTPAAVKKIDKRILEPIPELQNFMSALISSPSPCSSSSHPKKSKGKEKQI